MLNQNKCQVMIEKWLNNKSYYSYLLKVKKLQIQFIYFKLEEEGEKKTLLICIFIHYRLFRFLIERNKALLYFVIYVTDYTAAFTIVAVLLSLLQT
jgi:hypothetical protein